MFNETKNLRESWEIPQLAKLTDYDIIYKYIITNPYFNAPRIIPELDYQSPIVSKWKLNELSSKLAQMFCIDQMAN